MKTNYVFYILGLFHRFSVTLFVQFDWTIDVVLCELNIFYIYLGYRLYKNRLIWKWKKKENQHEKITNIF